MHMPLKKRDGLMYSEQQPGQVAAKHHCIDPALKRGENYFLHPPQGKLIKTITCRAFSDLGGSFD